MKRTIRRMTHEIIERNANLNEIVLLGVLKNGVPLAESIKHNISVFEGVEVACYNLDISGYRDDVHLTNFPKFTVDITGKSVVIVDDVLFTGRTVRAAMDAIVDAGRPSSIQLAVLIDRGHRELPIRADYVGKNVPTNGKEVVKVDFIDNSGVYIINKEN